MSDETGEWAQGMDRAWWGFQQVLAARLSELGDGDVVSLSVMGADDEGGLPYVQFMGSAGEGVLGEVSGNRWLSPSHVIDDADAELLGAIGWWAPHDESDPDQANYWFGADPDEVDRLAGMAAQALQGVFGVLHPAFLETSGLAEVDPTELDASKVQLSISYPTSADELSAHVDHALAPVFGHDPWRDDDGDIPVQHGESAAFVRAFAEPLAVEVFSVVVVGVTHVDRALVEVNALNRALPGPSYAVRGDNVLARMRVSAAPFVAQQMREAVAAFDSVDEVADDLVMRCGGRKWLADAPSVPAGRPLSGRSRVRTLVQLEEDQAGSVSPELAAHVFGHDQRVILDQIGRLTREGRLDLVPLLRRALRVVVEAGAEQGSSS